MSFGDQIMQAGDRALEAALEIAKVAAGNCCDSVVDKSPVRTGRFRSHWQGITGSEDFEPGEDLPTVSAETVKARVRSVLERWDGVRPFFLYNGLPYGPRLEYEGWSSQAPQGMVRISAAMWPFFVRDAARQVGGV